ncbi:metallophosphoesterase [Pseudanabaena sp. BC1403]|uniref:metallophosphoesterase family protein n=1 Tax=Pseudanabaena sp. BC1403 TaxID=2043171 RepID=UPI000CD80E88|nr:metallophosphoesterase [Pseudanabaena sp. BC1403]
MAFKRRQLLIFGGLVLGGGIGGAAFSGILNRKPDVAPTETASPIANNPKPTKSPTVKRSSNPAPKGLYAPVRGDVRIVVVSDLNSAYGSTDYIDQVKQAIAFLPDWEPDLVLCGGDMVAGQDNTLKPSEIEAMWKGFDKHIAAPIRKAKLPFGFTIGNHDASGSSFGGKSTFENDRNAVLKYWNDPKNDPNLNFVDRAGFPFYYTFEQNDVFFLTWDASTSEIPSEQLKWVEKSLASEAAKKAKLRIAIGHLPLYAVSKGRETAGNYLEDSERLRALLEKYNVHTYISGHHHAYYPAHKGKLELLHAGVLGDGPRRLLSGDLAPNRTVSVIDIKLETAETIYTTYDMDTLKVIDQSTLPRYIDAPNGRITRRDIKI